MAREGGREIRVRKCFRTMAGKKMGEMKVVVVGEGKKRVKVIKGMVGARESK